MIEVAEANFQFDIPSKGSHGSLRQRLEAREAHFGIRDPKLDALPSPPEGTTYLLAWFADLNMDRGSNGFGPSTLTSGMVLDWARGKGIRLRSWEFDVLRTLNRIWLKVWSDLNNED